MAKAYLLKQNEVKLTPVDINDVSEIPDIIGCLLPDTVYPGEQFAISFEDLDAFENVVLWIDDMGAMRNDTVANLELVTTLLFGNVLITEYEDRDADDPVMIDMSEEKAKHYLTKMVCGRRNPYRTPEQKFQALGW